MKQRGLFTTIILGPPSLDNKKSRIQICSAQPSSAEARAQPSQPSAELRLSQTESLQRQVEWNSGKLGRTQAVSDLAPEGSEMTDERQMKLPGYGYPPVKLFEAWHI